MFFTGSCCNGILRTVAPTKKILNPKPRIPKPECRVTSLSGTGAAAKRRISDVTKSHNPSLSLLGFRVSGLGFRFRVLGFKV